MGNRRGRDLTRPQGNGRSALCDQFRFHLSCTGTELTLDLLTDLPVGTRVHVVANRIFRTAEDSDWQWMALERNMPMVPRKNGLGGFRTGIPLERLDFKGLRHYRADRRSIDIAMAEAPSSRLTVSVRFPAERLLSDQRSPDTVEPVDGEHHFGLCNRGLTGSAVEVLHHGHRIERTASVEIPVCPAVLQRLGF